MTETKADIIKRLVHLIKETDRILSPDFIIGDSNLYFKELQLTVEFIRKNMPNDKDVEECIGELYIPKSKNELWQHYWLLVKRSFGSYTDTKVIKEEIELNKTALLHLYRAVAREEILSGKLPML